MSFLKELFSDRVFLKKTWLIAFPVTIWQALAALTNMVDNIMIGRLGEIQMGGVGLAGKVFFIVNLAVFGVSSGMSILASQYWGNDDIPNIRRVIGLGSIVSLAFALLCTLVCSAFPETVMGIFTDVPSLIACGSEYLRIAAWTFPFIAISNTFNSGLRSMDIVKPCMFISVAAIAVNVFFNWMLIFGNCGCAALGVAGAAYATIIARAVEMLLVILSLKLIKSPLWCHPKYYFTGYTKPMLRQFRSNAMTVVLNDTLWGIGYSLHFVTYGRMGESAAAAMSIISIFSDIEIVGLLGLSSATSVVLGNELGAGELDTAKKHAWYYIALGFMVGIVICIFTLALAVPVTHWYNISAETAAMTTACMVVLAVSLLWRSDNNITIVGILRAGGDTRVCALIDLLPMWLVSVPMVILSGLVWGLPLWAVFLIQQSDELIKIIISLIRVRTGKWIKNLNIELVQ